MKVIRNEPLVFKILIQTWKQMTCDIKICFSLNVKLLRKLFLSCWEDPDVQQASPWLLLDFRLGLCFSILNMSAASSHEWVIFLNIVVFSWCWHRVAALMVMVTRSVFRLIRPVYTPGTSMEASAMELSSKSIHRNGGILRNWSIPGKKSWPTITGFPSLIRSQDVILPVWWWNQGTCTFWNIWTSNKEI